jgi:hypothetical protein
MLLCRRRWIHRELPSVFLALDASDPSFLPSPLQNIPLIISWQSANTGAQSQRAVSLGSVSLTPPASVVCLSFNLTPPSFPFISSPVLNSIGQCLAILAAFLFPSVQGPEYTKYVPFSLLQTETRSATDNFYAVL